MLERVLKLPLLLQLFLYASLSMLVPAGYALGIDAFHTARMFLYTGLLGTVSSVMIAVALSSRLRKETFLRQLLALFVAFTALPVLLALPFYEALRTTSFLNAYVEMVSSFTTTGATLFDPERLSGPLHLWRAQVAWLGGLLIWIAAAAILAPLNLGGFEVTRRGEPGQGRYRMGYQDEGTGSLRMRRAARALVPTYLLLTGLAWLCLLIAGQEPLHGLINAMSALSTSGITATAGPSSGMAGLGGEIILFCFLIFALSRQTFSGDTSASARRHLTADPELRIAALLLIVVPALLFLRHWLGAFEVDDQQNAPSALKALWGAVFMVMSFLTTTGFESTYWSEAQNWSGLETPGMVFIGLAVMGGGVATTAGGVKLLRVYALYLNGMREMERMVHPSSISGQGAHSERFRRQGAFIAWVFFMLFALSQAVVAVALAALGSDFAQAMVLSVAALSTTGPLIELAGEQTISLGALGAGSKLVMAAAMVLGRLETLAIIALLTPDLYRR